MVTVDGRRIAGPGRLTQEEAAADYHRMRAAIPQATMQVLTLGEALERCVLQAEERGASPMTVQQSYRCHANYLLDWFVPGVAVTQIDADAVKAFIRAAREAGRSPNTLLSKDLPLLGRALEVGGGSNCIPEVRTELRQTLKRVPPQMVFLEPEELRDILSRMRDGVWRRVPWSCTACGETGSSIVEDRTIAGERATRCTKCRKRVILRNVADGRVHPIPGRHADADLVQLLALTGVRAGELGRIRARDCDMKRRTIRVVSKDRGHPRNLELVDALVPIVERLIAAARQRDDTPDAILVPDSMNTVNRTCRRWQTRLEEPRLHGRALRHSFATGLHYSGAAPVEVKGLAGHRNMSTTDRYTHEITRRRAAVAGAWAQHLLGREPDEQGEAPLPSPPAAAP